MKLHIAVCEDDNDAKARLSAQLTKWAHASGHAVAVSAYSSAEAFLFAYEQDKCVDVLLLDIEMKGMSGVELARRLRRENDRVHIVFTTSHVEFFADGFEVDALHYLVKPVADDKLFAALDKAVDRLATPPPSVLITCDGETRRLLERDIRYVEAFRHHIVLVTDHGTYTVKESISAFEGRLSADFYRVHRSYLVSLKRINRIARTAVWIDDETELPLARGKYDDIHHAYIERNDSL